MRLAFTRAPSDRLADCELTHLARAPIDLALARTQHAAYERALTAAGLEVRRIAPLAEAPDGVFVEDTALLLGEHAVITRPGAPSRRAETTSTAEALAQTFQVHDLPAGRVDGGDVLLVGRTFYVGPSTRTDDEGIEALRDVIDPLGYAVRTVAVKNCLHLKTCATFAGADASGARLLVFDPACVDPEAFADVEPIAVSSDERIGANVVRAGDTLLMAAGCPRLSDTLAARGLTLAELDVSEFRKAEAALSCLSLVAN